MASAGTGSRGGEHRDGGERQAEGGGGANARRGASAGRQARTSSYVAAVPLLHDDPDGSVPCRARERSAREPVALALVLVLAALWLAPGCASTDPGRRAAERAAEQRALEVADRVASGFVGVYAARRPAAAETGRAITLELRSDGIARLVNVYPGRGIRAESGRWSADADRLRVEWDNIGEEFGQPPMEWLRTGPALAPAIWDPAVWGDAGLPLTRWEASRRARAGCTWRPFADATLRLRLLVESCPAGVPGPRLVARGAEIVDIAGAAEGERGTPVIQMFSKPAPEPIDAAIRARFFPQMVPRMRAGCRVEPAAVVVDATNPGATRETWEIVPTPDYRAETAKWRAAEASAMVCGPYGQRDGRGFFGYQPDRSTTRYWFVWIGAEPPSFDEHSIELLE